MPTTRNGTLPFTRSTQFTVVVPDAPAPSSGHPVIVALHGAREDGARLRERLSRVEAGPFAVLYPDAPFAVEVREPPPARIGFAWYQYTGDGERFVRAMEESGAHLDRLIGAASAEHRLDPSRVLLLGYSQGGYLAAYHALKNASRFRALVAIACRVKVEALAEALPRARGFPVLVIHGRNDEFVKWEAQERAVAELANRGVAVETHMTDGGHGLRPEFGDVVLAFARRIFEGPGRH